MQATVTSNEIKSRTKLESVLQPKPGAPFATIATKTEPKLKAASRAVFPQGVTRISIRPIQVGSEYASRVNNQRVREGVEGEFKALPLWNGKGEHVGRFLVRHKDHGTIYLHYAPLQRGDSPEIAAAYEDRWIDNATGKVISEEDVKPFFYASSGNSRQRVENVRQHRTIKIENVISIRCGDHFKVNGQEWTMD